jgi:hypothetical protein
MFTCANCRKEKSDDERGSVGWLANIGFLVIMKSPWLGEICKDCSTQVRGFGIVVVFVIVVFTIIMGLVRLNG